jgi:chorismate mutase/prephenate dehydratase
MTQSIEQLRSTIDNIDQQIVGLLNQRAQTAKQIGSTKTDGVIYKPDRERSVINNALQTSTKALPDSAVETIYREIIAACRNLQQPLKVAYLGPEGTYSEEAARRHCGQTSEFVWASSIGEVLVMAENDQVDVAVVPIENSTEGSVSHTLDLLQSTPLTICGEVASPIHHQLLTNTHDIKHIKEVIAHPQALAQCKKWLDTHLPNVTRTPASSNAEAARQAANSTEAAAIAGGRAASIYKLAILHKNIEDEPNNTTRFLVLGKNETSATGDDKTSLICTTQNKPGALYRLLEILANQNINIVKLESRPSRQNLWEYYFYIDIDGHKDDAPIQNALEAIKDVTTSTKFLGSYPKGALL